VVRLKKEEYNYQTEKTNSFQEGFKQSFCHGKLRVNEKIITSTFKEKKFKDHT